MGRRKKSKTEQTWRDYTIRLNNNTIISLSQRYNCTQEHVLVTWYKVWCKDDENEMNNAEIWDVTEAILDDECPKE